jgi:hypothetical protein
MKQLALNVTSGLALLTLTFASPLANAHVSVNLGIGIPYAEPPPIYYEPPPRYYSPPPPVYYGPSVIYEDRDHDGYRDYDGYRHHRGHHGHHRDYDDRR